MIRRLFCRMFGHRPTLNDTDDYHHCGRCGESVLYESDGWRL